MIRSMRSAIALILLSVVSLQAAYDPDALAQQLKTKYGHLEAFNNQNEREGHPELNQYIIELSPDWISERTGKNESKALSPSDYTALADMLRAFNSNRKDKLRFYVIVIGFLEYAIEKDVTLEKLPKKFGDKNFNILFNNILNGKNKFEVYDHLFGTTGNNLRSEMLEAMKAKGYTERVLYCYTGLRLHGQDRKEKYYSVDNISLTGALESIQDKIRSKARQLWKYSDLPFQAQAAGERIKLAVANIITAIGVEYDGGGSSTTGIVNCGKDTESIANETFSHSTEYHNAVKSVAQLLDAPTGEQQVNSKFCIVDKPDNFKDPRLRELVLPDVVFNTEILPDKLNLLEKKSDYRMYVVFKEVPFVIPDDKREEFAQAVEAQSVVAQRANTIVIVVPYYSCTDNDIYFGDEVGDEVERVKYVYPMLLMPAAHSPGREMNPLMNAALIREKSFRGGFEQAFKHIPKDHMTYLGYLLWNGQQVFKEYPEKRVKGFSNFADVHLFVDDRIEKIVPYISNCRREYDNGIANSIILGVNGFYVVNNDGYERYLDCLTASQSEIKKMFDQNPAPLFKELNKELNAGKYSIRQHVLAGEDGMLTAMYYMQASYHNKKAKFWTENGAVVLEKVTLDDNLFYGNKNPYAEKPWILKPIDAGSFLASFIGWDFIFDAAGGVVCLAIGDDDGAAVYAASIFVPAAIIKSWKGIKEIRKIGSLSEEAYKLSAKSGVVAHTPTGPVVAQLGGPVNVVPTANDGTDLLRALGIADDEVLAIAKSDPSVGKALEESMTTRQGDIVISRPEQQIQYSVDELKAKANDKDLVKQYKEAREADPSLDFVSFLRQIEPKVIYQVDPVLADVAKYIKYDPDYFYVFIHGTDYDGFAVQAANGKGMSISHLAIADWLLSQKNFVDAITKEGKNIKLISCCAAANRSAQDLSARLHELSKLEGSPIKGASPLIEAPDVDYGVNILRSDAGAIEQIEEGSTLPNGKWFAYKDGKALGPTKKNPDIPQFTSHAGSRVSGNSRIYENLSFNISKFLDHTDVTTFKNEIIQKKIHEQFPNHTIDELTAIRYYTQKSEINRHLSQGMLDEFHQGLHYLLKSGLDKGAPYSKDVYSGLDKTKSLIADGWKVSDEITFDTYTSCAVHQIIGERYMNSFHGNVLLVIKDPHAMEISKISRYTVEEVLVQPGAKFKVAGIETDSYMGKTWKIVTLVRSPAGQ